MLASTKLDADFSRGVQVRGPATYFSRPSPTPSSFVNSSMVSAVTDDSHHIETSFRAPSQLVPSDR
jgi:hypothetical protein